MQLRIFGATLFLMAFPNVSWAQHHTSPPNTNPALEDHVQLEDHFGEKLKHSYYANENNKKDTLNRLIKVGGATVGVSLAGDFLKKRSRHKLDQLSHKKSTDAKRLLRRMKSGDRIAKIGIGSGLYLIADTVTGTVMATIGYEPIHYANLPTLATYLSRESVQGVRHTIELDGANMTEPAKREFDKFVISLEQQAEIARKHAAQFLREHSDTINKTIDKMEDVSDRISGKQNSNNSNNDSSTNTNDPNNTSDKNQSEPTNEEAE